MRIQPVIMSGGAGTRLWPFSRQAKPKQFQSLVGDVTLFQEAVLRLAGEDYAAPLIICGAGHLDHVERQLAEIDIEPTAIVIEPAPRNTAAVAAVAAAWTEKQNSEALVLLTPADHHIEDPAGFREAVAAGAVAAADGSIVTFGVKPTEPHTGFGYIEQGGDIAARVFKVAAFREKPDLETAKSYLASGRYHWNAGIFLYAPETMRRELTAFAPEIDRCTSDALARAAISGAVVRLDADAFSACPSDSVDYAVMERTDAAAVVAPVDVGWSDIGSWTAISTVDNDDKVVALDCEGSTIRTDGPLVAAIGLDDMIVVATGDAVLVAPKARAQDVKKIVEELKRRRSDLL